MGHIEKNGSRLQKLVTLEENGSHLEKMCHTHKNASLLLKWVTVAKIGQTLLHLEKRVTLPETGQSY